MVPSLADLPISSNSTKYFPLIIFLVFFTSALWALGAPHRHLQWPIVAMVLSLIAIAIKSACKTSSAVHQLTAKYYLNKEIIGPGSKTDTRSSGLLLMFISIITSAIICLGSLIHFDSVNPFHSVGLLVAIWLYLMGGFSVFSRYHPGLIVRPMFLAFAIVSLSIIIDFLNLLFLQKNLFPPEMYPVGIDVSSFNPANAFPRARGVFPEPGYAGWWLNSTMGSLLLCLMLKTELSRRSFFLGHTHRKTAFLFLTLYFPAILTTQSAAGFIAAIFAASIFSVVWTARHALCNLRLNQRHFYSIALSLITLICFFYIIYSLGLFNTILMKAQFSGASGADRSNRYSDALNSFFQHPLIGSGLGSTSLESGTGIVSFWLTALAEGGIFLFLALAFLWVAPLMLLAIRKNSSSPILPILAANIAIGFAHLAIVTGVDCAWSWLHLALLWYAGAKAPKYHKVNNIGRSLSTIGVRSAP